MESVTHLLQQGVFLRERHRYDESLAAFQQALAEEPNNSELHFQLSITHLESTEKYSDLSALESIENAIGNDPEISHYHSVKGLILIKLNKSKKGRQAAEQAISLDSENAFSWTVKAQSYFTTNEWGKAESDLEQALIIDADDAQANNLLAIVHRAQGKANQSEEEIAESLARNAEDPIAHANAGWAALRRHDQKTAETHFKKALLIDPENEFARSGLVESYKARSPLFRLFNRYLFFMQRFSQGSQIAMTIGLYVAFKFGKSLLQAVHPIAAGCLVVFYLTFVFWSWLANGIGNFLILKDPVARLSLKKSEKCDGIFVGGGFLCGIPLGILGYTLNQPSLLLLGGALTIGAIPWSRVFLHSTKIGRIVFSSIGTLIYALGLVSILTVLYLGNDHENTQALLSACLPVAFLLGLGSTWIAMIPGLQER